MEKLDLLGLLGPMTPLLFGLAFLVFWLSQRSASYILWTASAFIGFAFSSFLSLFIFSHMDAWLISVSALGNGLAMSFFVHALALRVKAKTPCVPLAIIIVFGLMLVNLMAYLYDDIGARILGLNIMRGMLSLTAAWVLMSGKGRGSIDKILGAFLLFVAPYAIISSFLNWQHAGLTLAAQYSHSFHWAMEVISIALLAVILGLILIVAFTSDLVQHIRLLSDIDYLTGAKTRRAFDLQADVIFARRDRSAVPISLVVADIDHFKSINDKYGHQMGDQVLRAFGQLMESKLRRTDIVGRIGGEEFCIILWNAPQAGAMIVAENLRLRFEDLTIEGMPKKQSVTASFGVVEISEGEGFHSAFARADKLMYQAKETGRNRVCTDVMAIKDSDDVASNGNQLPPQVASSTMIG